MTLDRLKPFQVEPECVDKQDIQSLTAKIKGNASSIDLHEIFEYNISLLAHFLKLGYIEYDEIYFLATGMLDEDNRPDYLCCTYTRKKGLSWYAISIAGSDDQVWESNLQFTPTAKRTLAGLKSACEQLPRSLANSLLFDTVDPDRIYGLLVMGNEQEFIRDRHKQDRKRKLNQTTNFRLRTYSSFLRHQERDRRQQWLNDPLDAMKSLLNK
jgi:hypothetical protein